MTGSGHVGAIIVTSSTPLWYATRATGLVALVLLTASMALGLLSSVRLRRPAWPRFVTLGAHWSTRSGTRSTPAAGAARAYYLASP
jgi:hypothetical protein